MSGGEGSAEREPEMSEEADAASPEGAAGDPAQFDPALDEELEAAFGEAFGEAEPPGDASLGEPDELGKMTAERDEYLDALRRLQAEFDNYRKRMVRQQTELLGRAAESLLERLLPVLDAVDLAMAHADGPGDADGGLARVSSLMTETLAREGLERIDEAGVQFDPTMHDAVAHEAAGDEAEAAGAGGSTAGHGHATVSEVLRAGYRLKGRVLRPAMVRVKG